MAWLTLIHSAAAAAPAKYGDAVRGRTFRQLIDPWRDMAWHSE